MQTKPQTQAEFVRVLRGSGWSQAEASRALGISPGAVSQICTGKTRPRTSTVKLLEEVTGRGRRGRPPLAPWEERLLGHARRLRPSERNALLVVARTMAREW